MAHNRKSIKLYFSYSTLIAFEYQDDKNYEKKCSLNDWSNTTGRFINEIQHDENKREPNRLIIERAEYLLGKIFENKRD